MASSEVRTFTDPEEFKTSLHSGEREITVTARGSYVAKTTTVNLIHMRLARHSDTLPRVTHISVAKELTVISFRTLPGPSILRNGVELGPSNVIRRGLEESYHQRSCGFANWGGIHLSVENMMRLGETVAGCNLTPPKEALSIVPLASAMARLQRLHLTAAHLAEYAPEVIAVPEAAHGLEQALIGALADCLGSAEIDQDRSALRRHAAIMRRFHRVIEENPDQVLFMPELCVAIGVSERVLRLCCQEQFGVSPKRYLLTRRMHLARRALRENTAANTTVTDIAVGYSFWQLGRFAVEYKSLFGESPSATLSNARKLRIGSRISSSTKLN